MPYYNNFRYGEISRRNSGRFDSEFYRQGCFTFRNMVTDFTGSATRRPPIRKFIDTDSEIIISFAISETLSYVIGLGKERIRLYRFVLDEFEEVADSAYPDNMVLTEPQIKEIRWAQYYNRIYFTHQDFRPFFMDLDTATDTMTLSKMTVILNQDAKSKYWFTPSYIADAEGKELSAYEGRVLYTKIEDGVTSYYFDEECTELYEYSAAYPPIQGNGEYITGFEDYEDDDLLVDAGGQTGNYPAGISIINDSIYLYGTRNHPNRIWKSRFLGSSQWIEGVSADTMHDFVEFQMVWTESPTFVDEENLPKVPMTDVYGHEYYEQENGNDCWWTPERNPETNEYLYDTRVYRKIPDYGSADDESTWEWYYSETLTGAKYDANANGKPVRKPLMITDFSDINSIMKTTVAIDYVRNDSCGFWFEANTGRMDLVRDIIAGCGYIFILTSTAELRLPSSFSAVNNRYLDPYTNYGSMNVRAVNLNSSIMFLQKSGILREFYLYQGYMANGDTTMLNHDILSKGVFQIAVKNTPDPRMFFIMEDGSCVTLTYDKENSIQSFSPWDMKGRKFVSAALLSGVLYDRMLFLIKSDTESWIGYLDEKETSDFTDEGKTDYISDIVTPYLEVVDQSLYFSRFKKAQTVFVRPYDTGRIEAGNAGNRLVTTKNPLGSNDWSSTVTGTSKTQSSFEIRSHKSEPMTILAYQYEVM